MDEKKKRSWLFKQKLKGSAFATRIMQGNNEEHPRITSGCNFIRKEAFSMPFSVPYSFLQVATAGVARGSFSLFNRSSA